MSSPNEDADRMRAMYDAWQQRQENLVEAFQSLTYTYDALRYAFGDQYPVTLRVETVWMRLRRSHEGVLPATCDADVYPVLKYDPMDIHSGQQEMNQWDVIQVHSPGNKFPFLIVAVLEFHPYSFGDAWCCITSPYGGLAHAVETPRELGPCVAKMLQQPRDWNRLARFVVQNKGGVG